MLWLNKPAPTHESNQSTYVARLFVTASNTNNAYSYGVDSNCDFHQLEAITTTTKPLQPLGMTPSALAIDKEGRRLYIVCSDADTVAVVDIAQAPSRVLGFIPTGWYPTSVALSHDGHTLYVTNAKGQGAGPNDSGFYPNPTRTDNNFVNVVVGNAEVLSELLNMGVPLSGKLVERDGKLNSRHRGGVRRRARRWRARRPRRAGARSDHGDENDLYARPLPAPRRRRLGAPAGAALVRGPNLKKKIYSPNQVLAVAFLGGPMAMVYVLWKNFQTLENPHGMHQILFWGSIFIVALMLFSPLLPNSRLDVVIPFAYPLAAWSLAESFQMSKQAIADSQIYEFQSAWNVIAVSIVFLVAMVVVTVTWFSVLVAVEVI